MWNYWLAVGSLFGMTGVALGAFGAHGLKSRVSEADLAIFETATKYQMYHVAALVLVGFLASKFPSGTITAAGYLFTIGTLVFSGSLYTLVFTGHRWLGAVTPVGGVMLIIGWLLVAISAFRLGS